MRKKITTTILLLLILCSLSGSVHAASYTYYGTLVKSKKELTVNNPYKIPKIYKVKFSSNKVTVYGTLNRYIAPDVTNSKALKNKKRTFKLADNVKFSLSGGDNPARSVSKSQFKACLKKYYGLALVLGVTNNKVVTMTISS